jgi:hypothetical protein
MLKHRIVLAATLALAASAASIALLGSSGSSRQAQDFALPAVAAESQSADSQVKAAVELALRTHQTMVVPTGIAPDAMPSDADLQALRSRGNAAINTIFAPAVAKGESKALDNAIAMEKSDHFKVLSAGIANVKYTNVDIDATTATVNLTVDTWSSISLRDPDGVWHPARPQNTLVVTMTLSQDFGSQRWTVQKFTWTFTPETRP